MIHETVETNWVIALDDTGKLYLPHPTLYTHSVNHDYGFVCHLVAEVSFCHTLDLSLFMVPRIAIDTEVYRAVYGVFRSRLFMGYYAILHDYDGVQSRNEITQRLAQ